MATMDRNGLLSKKTRRRSREGNMRRPWASDVDETGRSNFDVVVGIYYFKVGI